MSSEVIYARVPKPLKDAADAYASQRGGSLTKAVAELLDRGLTAVSDERSIAELEVNLARVTSEKIQAESELRAAKTELMAVANLSQRAQQDVGTCPNLACRQPISGYDLLATGRCRQCGQALSTLIAPATPSSTLDQRELMILLGALGAVVGIAYLASK
jgi:hypothetical protein